MATGLEKKKSEPGEIMTKQDIVFGNLQIQNIPVLYILKKESDRFKDIPPPTFFFPNTYQVYYPLRARILNIARCRACYPLDEEGKPDKKQNPLCWSNNGRGEVPSEEVPTPLSTACIKWKSGSGRNVRIPVCEYAKWIGGGEGRKAKPPQCQDSIAILLFLSTDELYWLFLDGVRLAEADNFLNKLNIETLSRKGVMGCDFIIEMSLRRQDKVVGNVTRTRTLVDYKVLDCTPDERVRDLTQSLHDNFANLLFPPIRTAIGDIDGEEE